MEPSFLIIDAYPKESRAEFDAASNRHAWAQYVSMLTAHLPEAGYEVWYPSDDPNPPNGPQAYWGILWTGCNLTIYEEDVRVTRQIEYAKQAYAVGTPSYGSCWGLQMAAVAAGGEVAQNPRGREMGLARNIRLTEEGLCHPFMHGKPRVFSAFISHIDQVTKLPQGATLLATNDFTEVQALCVTHQKGTFWAVQYHPEYHLGDMARLIVAREHKLVPEGFFQNTKELVGYVERLEELYQQPQRKDLRWQLNITDDVLDAKIRQTEFRNWLHQLVLPKATQA